MRLTLSQTYELEVKLKQIEMETRKTRHYSFQQKAIALCKKLHFRCLFQSKLCGC